MADDGGVPNFVRIPDRLKSQMSELQPISGTILSLAGRIDQINTLNKAAGGQDDATAKAYHGQIDRPTQDITTLVQELGTIFGVKADAGSDAADVLNKSGQDAEDIASAGDWTSSH